MTKKEQRELQELIRAIEQQKNKQHINNIAAYQAEVTKIFETVANEAARLGVNLNVPGDKLLSFDDIPAAKRRVNKLLKSMRQQLEATVVNGIEAEWALANAKNDALVEQVAAAGLTAAGNAVYFNNHAAALKAFKDRKTSGMNLSKRVWNLTQQYKTELEMGLDIGIREGLSAQEMSRQMKQYLKYPDKLFRRVRDEHGVLQLSKAAAAFHPGRGVYRSSHMNALRLTGTETNMAYRTADHERIQDLDFVVGIRVVMSNNHTIKGPKGLPIPLTDICDELSVPMGSTATKGRGCYPKGFKFTGWHPNCRCHTETILLSRADFENYLKAKREGKACDITKAKGYVAEPPAAFDSWIDRNRERAKGWTVMPKFVKDNYDFVQSGGFEVNTYSEAERVFTRARHTSPAMEKALTDLKGIAPALSNTEVAAIYNYSRADVPDYRRLNKQLRTGELSVFNSAFSELLSAALKKLPTVQCNVYRIIRLNRTQLNNFLDLAKTKATTTFEAFTSTSADFDKARKFMSQKHKPKRNERDVMLAIKSNSGHPIPRLTMLDQGEVLFDKGLKVEFLDYLEREDGLTFFLQEAGGSSIV